MLELMNMPLEGKITLDIEPYASAIELACAEHILSAPKGIYIKNRLEPVMMDGNNYYTRSGTEAVLITDINVIKENVYDENNKLVIPKAFMLKKDKFISNESMLPYRGCKIVELLMNYWLDQLCQYRKMSGNKEYKAMQHLAPLPKLQPHEYPANITAEELHELECVREAEHHDLMMVTFNLILQSLRKELDLFVGNLNWNMYFVKLTDCHLSIERYCDWRAYQWEIEHGEKFRSSSN